MEFLIRAQDREIAAEVREFIEQALDALTSSRTDFVVTTEQINEGWVKFDVGRRS